MKAVLCIFACLILAAFASFDPSLEVNHPDWIAHVNSLSSTWQAGVNEHFNGWTMEEVKHILGVNRRLTKHVLPQQTYAIRAIPDSFDSRQQWPKCSSIGTIFDQGFCGSCWAFGAVESLNDRYCITNGGSSNPLHSFEDLVSCCGFSCGQGCNGGYPEAAWEWFVRTGVSSAKCYPYEIPGCNHPCGKTLPTPKCHKTCNDSEVYAKDRHYAKSAYNVQGNVNAIAQEIMTNGPVEAAFSVYADFPAYKSGVYKHTTGAYLGGHAIKIIGWGTESGTPYWLVVNSWNTNWGDKGYFKIFRGADECGIESQVCAGLVKLA